MMTLQFADTYNLVAFLSKPIESEVFEQIATVKVKTVNEEVQLQALVDGKKIIVIEASVRRDLQLNDEECTDCLPNATIFEELTRIGYERLSQKLTFYKSLFSPQWKFLIHTILQCLSAKTTAWNEFSITMASVIICLATNQKFNFSKYIFESMVKNLDNVGKFFMYPRFVQVFLEKQLEGMSNNKRIYVTPSHTKKIYRNMRRVGKGFSGRDIPLFPIMMVQAQQEQGEADEAVYKERVDSLVRAATTASSLEAEKDSGNIDKTRSKATLNEPSFLGTSSGVNTPRSDEDRLKLNELMEFCTKLQHRVLDLENTKTAQAQEITSLKLRVKKLEKKGGSRTHKLQRLYKFEITLVHETQGRYGDEEMFNTDVLDGDKVLAEPEVTVKDVNLSVDEVTLAQALAALKIVTTTTAATTITVVSTRPKAKRLVIHKEEQATTPTVSSQQPSQVKAQDKGKGIMVEEPVKMKKKDQISLDEELAFKLQAEEEEERLAREKAQQIEEANIVAWDNVQEMIDDDYQMAQQMQAEEQEKLSIKEKSKFEVRVEGSETRAEGSSKRAGEELEPESSKKPKLEEDKETTKLQRLIEVVPDTEEVAIDVIPLATKPPSIVDYKIHKEGKKTYY
ncbi:hypothetical protein Tco_0456035 [Tanacetum coccineum]